MSQENEELHDAESVFQGPTTYPAQYHDIYKWVDFNNIVTVNFNVISSFNFHVEGSLIFKLQSSNSQGTYTYYDRNNIAHETAICFNPHNSSNRESHITRQLRYKHTFQKFVSTKRLLLLTFL